MRYVDRGEPPAPIATELARCQAGVTAATNATEEWRAFSQTETFQALGRLLRERFRNKCAYCEAADRLLTIEHFWPKAPHVHNGMRGTPLRMYRWDNLLPACRDCQSFDCKGSHMKWNSAGNPMLLDPCRSTDDPIHYVEIVLRVTEVSPQLRPELPAGWMDPRSDIPGVGRDRAEETIRCLRLNQAKNGRELWRSRAERIQRFQLLLWSMRRVGPDTLGPDGKPLRALFAEVLGDHGSFLAGIRQILHAQPDSDELRTELIAAMPELEPLIEALAPAPAAAETGLP